MGYVLPPLNGGLHCSHVSCLLGYSVAVQHGGRTGLTAPGGRAPGRNALDRRGGRRDSAVPAQPLWRSQHTDARLA